MSVYKKLHQVQKATRSLAANAEGQTGAARYNYVSGSKLLATIRPLMDNLGLMLTQEILEITNQPITYMTRNGEKTEMFTTCHIKFTWVDTEDGSTLENHFYSNGMNAWDKGLGSCLTYAERYYLMKTFHIATDEDDIDALVKDEAINVKQAAAEPKPRKKETAPSYTPVSEELYYKLIEGYANGTPTKSGADCKTWWINKTHANAEAVTKFDVDVANYCLANKLKLPTDATPRAESQSNK